MSYGKRFVGFESLSHLHGSHALAASIEFASAC